MKANKVAIIIRDENNLWEGLRSCLGLGVEMIETHMFVLGRVWISEERENAYAENLEFLNDLEGRAITDNEENVARWSLFEHMSLDGIAGMLPEYDLIIPF